MDFGFILIAILALPALLVAFLIYVPLKGRIDVLEREVQQLKRAISQQQQPVSPTLPPLPVTEQPVVGQPVAEEAPVVGQPVVDAPQPPAEAQPRNWERFIGQNLLGKIGMLVLVMGVAYFVKYAIDRNWIDELMRTILGLVVGGVLMGLGYWLRNRYRAFSSVLAGGGYAVMFATVAIAHNYYSIFGTTLAMRLLVGFTVGMAVVSMVFRRRELAVTALLGGFVAPFIISVDTPSLTSLLGYVAVLNAGMAVVAIVKKWSELPLISFVATYIIASTGTNYGSVTSANAGVVLALEVAYFLLLMTPMVVLLVRGDSQQKGVQYVMNIFMLVALAFNGLLLYNVAHYPIFYFKGVHDSAVSLFVCAAHAVAFGLVAWRKGWRVLQDVLLGIALIALYAGVRSESDTYFTPVYIAVVAIGLLRRFPVVRFAWIYQIFLGILVICACKSSSYYDTTLPMRWTVLLLTVAATAALGWIFYGREGAGHKLVHVRASKLWHVVACAIIWISAWIVLFITLGHKHSDGIAISLALTTAGFIVMGLGMRWHSKDPRLASLGMFAIVLAKLILNDVWTMSSLGKIIVFSLLGVLLLILSFLYNRLKSALFPHDEDPSTQEEL